MVDKCLQYATCGRKRAKNTNFSPKGPLFTTMFVDGRVMLAFGMFQTSPALCQDMSKADRAQPWSRPASAQPNRAPTPVTRPGSAAPWRESPESTSRGCSPLYDCVGIHSGVPPDLALPAEARQAGVTRLSRSVLRELRPDSARRGRSSILQDDDHCRPSTAPAARGVSSPFAQRHPQPGELPHFGQEALGEDRPRTAPAEERPGAAQRSRLRQSTEDAVTELQGTLLEGDEEEDGVTTFQLRPQSAAAIPLVENEADMTEQPTFRAATSRSSRVAARLAGHPLTRQLRRTVWRPEAFLALRSEVLQPPPGNPEMIAELYRFVGWTTRKALEDQGYTTRDAREGGDRHVSFWPEIGRCDIRWYGDAKPHLSFDAHPKGKEPSDDAVVTTAPVLETLVRLASVCPGKPLVLIAEAVEFDDAGGVDQRHSFGVVPDDLLLRSDLGRFLDETKRSCRQWNQHDGRPKSTLRDYLADTETPFVARFKEVALFRGAAEQGYPFLEEPMRITVILMSMPRQRTMMQRVHYQTKPPVDWYEQLTEYHSVASRFLLAARAIKEVLAEQEDQANKALVVMSMPGCAGNAQQPYDAMATCIKHWKQNYSELIECLHICCRNRRGPDDVMTACVRAAVNLRERPAPGLDAQHRQGAKLPARPKRMQGNKSILDDPLDEDETDEAVAQFRALSEHSVQFGTNRRGSIVWTATSVSDVMRHKKKMVEERNQMRALTRPRDQAMAMATVNLVITERRKSADMSSLIPLQALTMPAGAAVLGQSQDEADDTGTDASESCASFGDPSLPAQAAIRPELREALRRSSAPDLRARRKSDFVAMEVAPAPKRRASAACISWTQECPDWERLMPEKVKELEEMSKLAKQSLQAKAASRMLNLVEEMTKTHFDRRRRSSVTGQLGAGEDFNVFEGKGQAEQTRSSRADKEGLGESLRLATCEGSPRPHFVTDDALKLRQDTRNRLSVRLDAEPISASSRRASHIDELAAKQAVHIQAANQHITKAPRQNGRLRFCWDKGQSFALPVPPKDRPFASLHTQFRRRNMRENLMIFRGRCEEELRHADLLDMELAVAECEGEALKVAAEVRRTLLTRPSTAR
ncbi:unnamed protein product [Effrenium voratum]|nr:unnamed protein product [Effrenium voratum]